MIKEGKESLKTLVGTQVDDTICVMRVEFADKKERPSKNFPRREPVIILEAKLKFVVIDLTRIK